MKHKTRENRNIYNIDMLHVINHLYKHKTKTSDVNYLLNQYVSLNLRMEMYAEWLRLKSTRKGAPYEKGQSYNFIIIMRPNSTNTIQTPVNSNCIKSQHEPPHFAGF